ncbi:MAG TPA: flagellar protein FlaG [Sulfurivirga caldicuralii]|nr:flagellar protein FlaG [Sulfurivirga caldicuralii]
MSLEIQKNQLVGELPLSITKQRDTQKQLVAQVGEQPAQNARQVAEPEKKSADAERETLQRLQQQTDRINERIQSSALKFEVEAELGTTVVKVIDTQTNEVIRQIPSEEAIARLRNIQAYLEQNVYSHAGSDPKIKDVITGLIVNQTM